MPLAERSGLIVELTNWVVREAIRQRRIWQDAGLYLTIAIDVSAVSLTEKSLLTTFRSALDEHGVSPFSVEIELTETGVMENPAKALQVLERFDQLGVHAAIDDFGTGFSSLVYLRDLPVHTLKIDKSFVIGMVANQRNSAIISSTIALGHALGLLVVAEGVEDEASAVALRDAGCNIGQGYYWSKPLPADALVAWLAQFVGGTRALLPVSNSSTKDQFAVEAMRRLLAAVTATELRDVLAAFVVNVGGGVVSADEAHGPGVMQLDLTLGEGDALLPTAGGESLARQHLEELLPMLIIAARMVLAQQRTADHSLTGR